MIITINTVVLGYVMVATGSFGMMSILARRITKKLRATSRGVDETLSIVAVQTPTKQRKKAPRPLPEPHPVIHYDGVEDDLD